MFTTKRFFEGWYVVGAVFVVLAVNAGLGFYGLAVYLEAITDEQGYSTASVSLATSLFFIIGGVTGRLIAPVIQTRDIRLVIAAGAVLSGLGLVLVGRTDSLTELYLAYVVFAVGFGLCGLVPATTLVTRWFEARRSVALSIASTGLSVGGLTFTVFAAMLIERRGLADATPILAFTFVAVIGVALFALWPDPRARGQFPDGTPPGTSSKTAADAAPSRAATTLASETDATSEADATSETDATSEADATSVDYEQAIASPFFRLVTAGFVFAMAAQVGGIAQIAKLGSERVDAGTGTLLVSSIAAASVVARLIGGVIATRVRLVLMVATLAVGQGLSLAFISVSDSRTALVIGAIVFGATIGNVLMLHPLVLADRFGVVNYPKIFALSQLVSTFGVAGGPYLLGWLHDQSSYRLSYLVASVLSALGGVIFAAAWVADRNARD